MFSLFSIPLNGRLSFPDRQQGSLLSHGKKKWHQRTMQNMTALQEARGQKAAYFFRLYIHTWEMVAGRVTPPVCSTVALVGSTNPAPSAMLRSSASGQRVIAPNLPAVTMVAPQPMACTRPPLCACNIGWAICLVAYFCRSGNSFVTSTSSAEGMPCLLLEAG